MDGDFSLEEIERQIQEIKEEENIIFKYKYELLNILYYNIKLYRKIKEEDHPIVNIIKRAKILLERIEEKIKKMGREQLERRRRNIEKEITENKEEKRYRSKERNTPRKKYKKGAEKIKKSTEDYRPPKEFNQ